MKTEIYKFIIELPDGQDIESDEYDNMLEQMKNDKIAFVFDTLTISHNKIK